MIFMGLLYLKMATETMVLSSANPLPAVLITVADPEFSVFGVSALAPDPEFTAAPELVPQTE